MKERVQKLIAKAGIASRREAESFIRDGLVTINGKKAQLGDQADLYSDHVKVKGKLIHKLEEPVFLFVYKPRGVIVSCDDPIHKNNILTLVPPQIKGRLFPVGRLDLTAEGIVLLTNDGEVANKLIHPRYHVEKVYQVKVSRTPDEKSLRRLEKGLLLESGERTLPSKVRVLKSLESDNCWVEVTLVEGKNHQIRRMFQSVGIFVTKIKRVKFGNFSISMLKGRPYRKVSKNFILKNIPTAN